MSTCRVIGLGFVVIGIGRNQDRLRGPPKTSSRFSFKGRYLIFTLTNFRFCNKSISDIFKTTA